MWGFGVGGSGGLQRSLCLANSKSLLNMTHLPELKTQERLGSGVPRIPQIDLSMIWVVGKAPMFQPSCIGLQKGFLTCFVPQLDQYSGSGQGRYLDTYPNSVQPSKMEESLAPLRVSKLL